MQQSTINHVKRRSTLQQCQSQIARSRRGCGWLMNSTRGTKGKYGLKDKKEMVGGGGSTRGIKGKSEKRNNCTCTWWWGRGKTTHMFLLILVSTMYNNIDKKTFTYHCTPVIIYLLISTTYIGIHISIHWLISTTYIGGGGSLHISFLHHIWDV